MRTRFSGIAATILALAVSGAAAPARADSVDFAVGAVSVTVETTNFKLKAAQAFLRCQLREPSGTYVGYPTVKLPTAVEELGPGVRPGSTRYRIDAEGGQLSEWRIYAELQGCEYGMLFESEKTAAEIPLAGSAQKMLRNELGGFLADEALNLKISRQYQPLVLQESLGAITQIQR